jgi:putative transposase
LANVLDKLPKRLQARAKDMLREIMYAPDRESALEEIGRFSEEYGARYPKAVETLTKDQDQLLTFFDFPAKHWIHLRTTNPIESTFSTVKTRILAAEKRWRRVNAPHLIALVKAGVKFPKGEAEMLQSEPAPEVFTFTPSIFAAEEASIHNI